jgi:cytochrome c1
LFPDTTYYGAKHLFNQAWNEQEHLTRGEALVLRWLRLAEAESRPMFSRPIIATRRLPPRIEAIFAAARAQPPASRPSFLDRACADNPALRQEVASLLAADDDVIIAGAIANDEYSLVQSRSGW